MTLLSKLEAARAEVARLEREAAQATCRELGKHDWKLIGGRNADCGCSRCGCSAPVYECTRCGDCGYGDNSERDDIVLACAELNG